MNRNQEIIQEIENKLVKDDYASTLPPYHPAKGRRKKGLRDQDQFNSLYGESPINNLSSGSNGSANGQGENDEPDGSPEVEDPDQEEVNPERDFPEKEINYPSKEEIPDPEPRPEIQNPDKKEFGKGYA